MIRKLTPPLFAFVILAFAGAAIAFQDGVNLKRSPKVGESEKFDLSGDLSFMGESLKLEGKLIRKVVKVEDNGQYEIEATTTDMKVSKDGEIQDLPESVETQILKSTGEVLSIKGADNVSIRSANLAAIVVPDRMVKVGDSWDVEYKSDEKTGAVDAKGTYKVEAQEKVGSVECYRIKSLVKETGENKNDQEMELWLDMKDGSLVKAESTMHSVNPNDPDAVMTTKITMTRS